MLSLGCRRLAFGLVWIGALAFAPTGRAAVSMKPSAYLQPVADPACDLVITPANASTTLNQLNDPGLRVFCIDPGDYRSYGGRILREPGTE
jgi:hypothetical protein